MGWANRGLLLSFLEAHNFDKNVDYALDNDNDDDIFILFIQCPLIMTKLFTILIILYFVFYV
jgi:hypothetical protein